MRVRQVCHRVPTSSAIEIGSRRNPSPRRPAVTTVTIAKLLGHAMIEATEPCIHLSGRSVSDAAERGSGPPGRARRKQQGAERRGPAMPTVTLTAPRPRQRRRPRYSGSCQGHVERRVPSHRRHRVVAYLHTRTHHDAGARGRALTCASLHVGRLAAPSVSRRSAYALEHPRACPFDTWGYPTGDTPEDRSCMRM